MPKYSLLRVLGVAGVVCWVIKLLGCEAAGSLLLCSAAGSKCAQLWLLCQWCGAQERVLSQLDSVANGGERRVYWLLPGISPGGILQRILPLAGAQIIAAAFWEVSILPPPARDSVPCSSNRWQLRSKKPLFISNRSCANLLSRAGAMEDKDNEDKDNEENVNEVNHCLRWRCLHCHSLCCQTTSTKKWQRRQWQGRNDNEDNDNKDKYKYNDYEDKGNVDNDNEETKTKITITKTRTGKTTTMKTTKYIFSFWFRFGLLKMVKGSSSKLELDNDDGWSRGENWSPSFASMRPFLANKPCD